MFSAQTILLNYNCEVIAVPIFSLEPVNQILNNSVLKSTPRYVEIKCQLDATEVFIADLIACSTCFGHHYAHHKELKSIIQWLLPVVFRAVKM